MLNSETYEKTIENLSTERIPYRYGPSLKECIFWFPIYSALLDASERLAEEMDSDELVIEGRCSYHLELQKLGPERGEETDKGIRLREVFAEGFCFPTSWMAAMTDNIPVREQKTGNARSTTS